MRHGQYDLGTSRLTEKGEDGVKKTSRILKDFLDNKNYIVFHSPEIRSKQTAGIFNQVMGNNHTLFENRGIEIDNLTLIDDFLYEEIRQLDDTVDVVVLSAHMPIMDVQTMIYRWKDFPKKPDFASGYIIEVDGWSAVNMKDMQRRARPVARFTPQKLEIL